MKIMVVEDDLVSMALLKKALSKINASVITATTGLEALDLIVNEGPRIVITDWMMPELDGLELCRRIRQHHNDLYTYVVITTGKNEKSGLKAIPGSIYVHLVAIVAPAAPMKKALMAKVITFTMVTLTPI